MTLLELLIAMAVFAILSMMAYGGLKAVVDADIATRQQAEVLTRLQRALARFGSDLSQLVARPVRGAYGDHLPALDGGQPGYLEWTRAGWANPVGHPRSSLQRVAWGLEDGNLVRSVWYVLDRAQDTQPQRLTMVEGVDGVEFRLLDSSRQWRDTWPLNPGGDGLSQLPIGVEMTLRTRRWGEIRRLIPLPQRPE